MLTFSDLLLRLTIRSCAQTPPGTFLTRPPWRLASTLWSSATAREYSSLGALDFHLAVPRPFADLYTWDKEGKGLEDVPRVPVGDLLRIMVKTACAAREVVECTGVKHAAAWGWCVVAVLVFFWLYFGCNKEHLRTWRSLLRLVLLLLSCLVSFS